MEKCQPAVAVNLKNTKYSTTMSPAIEKLRWKTSKHNLTGKNKDWDVLWTDSSKGIEKVLQSAKSYQKLNHFPSMYLLTGKGHLARSISKMQRVCVASDFTPRTWILPLDYNAVTRLLSDGKNEKCVIVKQCRGNYKYLAMTANMINRTEPCTVQVYISRPLLIDGYKFTLRVFVLILSIDPLRLYIYKEGIVQLCTVAYSPPNEANIENTFMHMTTFSSSYAEPSYASSRDRSTVQDNTRSLSWLWNWLLNRGNSKDKIWQEISDIVVRTVISVQSPVSQAVLTCKFAGNNKNPFTCFELLAFDFLLTDTTKPYLISVKSSPPLSGATEQETRIKVALCENTLSLLNMTVDERLRFDAFRGIESQIRLYGDAFDSKQRVSQGASYELKDSLRSDYIDRLNEQPKSYWKRFFANEAKHMGNFQLLFPTDVYPQQPTAGKQMYYDKLLDLAEAMYLAATNGIFNGYLQPVEAHDADDVAQGSEKPSQQVSDIKEEQPSAAADKYATSLANDAAQDTFLQALLENERDEGREIIADDLFSSVHSSQPGGEYLQEQKEEKFLTHNQFPVIPQTPFVSGTVKFINIKDSSYFDHIHSPNPNSATSIGSDSKNISSIDNRILRNNLDHSGMKSSFVQLQDLQVFNVPLPDAAASLTQSRPRSSFKGGGSTRSHSVLIPPPPSADSHGTTIISENQCNNSTSATSPNPHLQGPEESGIAIAASRSSNKPASPRNSQQRSMTSNIKKQRPLVSISSTDENLF